MQTQVSVQMNTPLQPQVIRPSGRASNDKMNIDFSVEVEPSIPIEVDYLGHHERRSLSEVVSGWRRPNNGECENKQECECIYTTIRRLDSFIGGFTPARVSLLDGQHEFMFNILARTIVNAIKGSDDDVVYVDGGNTLDPYLLTTACRLFKINADTILRRVQVARAFTVFQLDTLITQNLEQILKKRKPKLVVVSCISELFLDRDVDWHEARVLFDANIKKLLALTEKYNVITLLTNFGRNKSIHRFELERKLRKWLAPELRFSLKQPTGRKLRVVKGTGEFMDYLPLPPYQWSLDDFSPDGDLCG